MDMFAAAGAAARRHLPAPDAPPHPGPAVLQVTRDTWNITANFSIHNKPVNPLWNWTKVPVVPVEARAYLPSTSYVKIMLGNGACARAHVLACCAVLACAFARSGSSLCVKHVHAWQWCVGVGVPACLPACLCNVGWVGWVHVEDAGAGCVAPAIHGCRFWLDAPFSPALLWRPPTPLRPPTMICCALRRRCCRCCRTTAMAPTTGVQMITYVCTTPIDEHRAINRFTLLRNFAHSPLFDNYTRKVGERGVGVGVGVECGWSFW